MEVTLLSISLGIAIIAFVVNYLYFSAKIEGKDREISRIIQEHHSLNQSRLGLIKSCDEFYNKMVCAEAELKKLKNETAKDSVSIAVDEDKLLELIPDKNIFVSPELVGISPTDGPPVSLDYYKGYLHGISKAKQ